MKSLEKSIADWKRKCSDLQSELDGLGGDARSAAAEAFRYKSEIEERDDQIEALRREIRGLRKYITDHKMIAYRLGQSNLSAI